jgi:hypothetical protein
MGPGFIMLHMSGFAQISYPGLQATHYLTPSGHEFASRFAFLSATSSMSQHQTCPNFKR